MERIQKKIWLKLLYLMVFLKKTLFWLLNILQKIVLFIINIFHHTAGPKIYRLIINWQKKFSLSNLPWYQKIWQFLGQREILQTILLVVIVIIAIPQSKLYAKDNNLISGQNTILYKIVGPGEDYNPAEEALIDFKPLANNQPGWKTGSVVSTNINAEDVQQFNDQNNYAFGGTAIIKPLINPNYQTIYQTPTTTSETNNQAFSISNYIIQKGDTLQGIAKKFSIKQETIFWANNLTAKSTLKVGTTLKILSGNGVLYTVKKGDNISKIALTHKADINAIITANNLNSKATNLKVGQNIFIPNGTKPATPKPVVINPTTKPTATQNNQTIQLPGPGESAEVREGVNYVWPTAVRRITQYFSWRHTGVDIAGPISTPIYATRAGIVIKSQCGWNGGYGCYIIIDHGDGVQSLYGHNSQLFVEVGDYVAQGQNISLMGSTGRSTGPHCHFEIRVRGARVNPLKYIK